MEAHGFTQGLTVTAEPAVGRGGATAWRVVDVLVAGLLLLVLVPLLLLVALVIKLDSPGPVIFRQWRIGLDMRVFSMRKLRTMRCDCESSLHREFVAQLIETGGNGASPLYKLAEDPRVTRVGRFLRRWSIDELPQLWNVLRGDMSLVGPRPAIPYELDHYEQGWYERFAVKPGITGLWQVSGRSRLSFRDMVDLDVAYVDTRSFWLNVRILARTFRAVFDSKGAG